MEQNRKFALFSLLVLYSYGWGVGEDGILLVFRYRDVHEPPCEWVSVESFSWISLSVNVNGGLLFCQYAGVCVLVVALG